MSSPSALAEVAQAQLDAYNAQDLEAHCVHFTDDIVVSNLNGDLLRSGAQAYRDFHIKLFADFPGNRATLVNRIVIGNTVIDHEQVDRGAGDPPFQVAAIYTFRGDKIARADFVR